MTHTYIQTYNIIHTYILYIIIYTYIYNIREYGSTLYVGWPGKKMAAHTFQLQVVSSNLW